MATQTTSRRSKRSWVVGGVCVALFAVIYVYAVTLYANSGKSTVAEVPQEVKNGVNVDIQLVDVDAMRREITMRIAVQPAGNLDLSSKDENKIGFAKPVRVTFWQTPSSGAENFVDIGVGQAYALQEVKFLIDGDVEQYPIDYLRFGGDPDLEAQGVLALPFLSVQELDNIGKPVANTGEQFMPDSKNLIPIGMVQHPDGTTGWSESWTISSIGSSLWMDAVFKRAGGTLAFVVVVLTLMAVLAIAALSVSIRVFRRPGTIEATMASWQAALLFALIPLRNFLPGAPPIGAWIDILVFYWVILALMLSMALFTYTWLRDRGQMFGRKKAKSDKV